MREGSVKIERGRVKAKEKEGYIVDSITREGITTPPLPSASEVQTGDCVYFFLFDDGHGMILSKLDEATLGGGKDGADGKSAYEIAVKNGFTGTETEWLASLKGKDGAHGEKGETGKTGASGKDGKDGKDGLTTSVNGVQQVGGAVTLKAAHIKMNSGKTIEAALAELLTVQDLTSKVTKNTTPQVMTVSRAGKLVTLAMKTEQRIWASGNLIITLPPEAYPTGQIDVPVVLGAAGQGVFRITMDGKCKVATISDTTNSKSMFVAVSYIAAK